MTDIIDLDAWKLERTPHQTGEVVCTHCKHRWQAVAPEEVHEFECPSCGMHKGVWCRHQMGVAGDEYFECPVCKTFFFHLMRSPDHGEYFMCVNCGHRRAN